ncbi:hypothetical protein M422DRAFT_781888 [Sphaerobolus stellatus SS14]|uniref:Phosphoglycerate mutase family protein n=1 Tax=Sphaerobolus stellatus (strain SS14) TaxID=990650 RepID=A0A0C9UR10_SPHS4|nr:hypothetical protein M422DRAFT_781888 [Sphaerobolus stellatus SS14]
MPFWKHDSAEEEQRQAYDTVTNVEPGHKAHISHELIAAAASYEAAKAYEQHVSANGKPDSHAQAKEIMAGLAGAFIDRLAETKGEDFYDKEKAKHAAKKHAHENFEFGSGDVN